MGKITVIGAGSVGAAVANDLMVQGIASEILLVDVNKKKAKGEALDIYQGAPFHSPAVVRSGDYADAAGSNIVVITCGIARKPGMTRLDLAKTNVNIIKEVAKSIVPVAPEAKYVIVSNPVDILTYVFHKVSGLPENQIIGSGTILDTSRLQSELAKRFHISPKNVHANNHVDDYKDCSPDKDRINWNKDYAEVEEFVKKSGAKVIENKGATFYAVSMAVCHICKCLSIDAGTALTVSTMMHGEYGIEDVCLSTLALVDDHGVRGKITNRLTAEEIAKLQASADKLKAVIAQIEI